MRPFLATLLLIALVVPAGAGTRPRAEYGTAPGQIYGFGTSQCKSSDCFSKHPSGRWLHPLTVPYGSGRSHRR